MTEQKAVKLLRAMADTVRRLGGGATARATGVCA
jgi:hypothetical protein